jgi:hypothetical protein
MGTLSCERTKDTVRKRDQKTHRKQGKKRSSGAPIPTTENYIHPHKKIQTHPREGIK